MFRMKRQNTIVVIVVCIIVVARTIVAATECVLMVLGEAVRAGLAFLMCSSLCMLRDGSLAHITSVSTATSPVLVVCIVTLFLFPLLQQSVEHQCQIGNFRSKRMLNIHIRTKSKDFKTTQNFIINCCCIRKWLSSHVFY